MEENNMWDSVENKIPFCKLNEDEIIATVNKALSQGSKTSTYKFAFFKSILDNIFNVDLENNFLDYEKIAFRFTEIYWNLSLHFGLKQMISYDGKVTSVEKKIKKFYNENFISNVENAIPFFESISEENKLKLTKIIKSEMLKYVVGAFCFDTNYQFYHFDKKNLDGIKLNPSVYNAFVKYKTVFEKQNYFEWIKYLEKANKEEDSYKLAEKLDFSTKRSNLSEYRKILQDFGQNKCFYCGKTINSSPVDHFIPWSFVKDDKMWNFVLACQTCNSSKNDKLPSDSFIEKVKYRNEKLVNFQNKIIQFDFKNYNHNILYSLKNSAIFNGFSEWNVPFYRINHEFQQELKVAENKSYMIKKQN